jgi:hypothetical protein
MKACDVMEHLPNKLARRRADRLQSADAEAGVRRPLETRAPDGMVMACAPAGRGEPWTLKATPVQPPPPPVLESAGTPALIMGIERRLVRRAEAQWRNLRPAADGRALPPAESASALLRAPFAGHALLVTLAPASASRPDIGWVGDALAALADEPVGPGGGAAVIERLAALGARAIRQGEPLHLDTDEDVPEPGSGPAQLLMRAVALPLAPGPDGACAIVIASWRRLLSGEETAALHRELAAAMDWMHQQRLRA